MDKIKKVLIMAGGTGGHVFPGLAVAKALQKKNIEVHWLGTEKGLETTVVPAAHIPIHYIAIHGVRGKGWKDIFLSPFRLFFAVLQSLRMIRSIKPDVVVGFGGFVSGPGGIAAWLLRKKLMIHEQNAKPGTTNKWLARVATKIFEGFPDTFPERFRHKVITAGNPVRAEITEISPPEKRFEGRGVPLRLLVLGGSLGAEAINQLLPQVLFALPAEQRLAVLHQTGKKHFENAEKSYAHVPQRDSVKVVPFIEEMDQAYAWADLVICRAGALTIAELCAVGLGAILVPFPFAIDDHQTANAEFMVKHHAGLLIQQADLSKDLLADILQEFCAQPENCITMARAAYQVRRVDATEKVVNTILN